MGEITVFVEVADEAPTRPRPNNPAYDGARPTPRYTVMFEALPREPTLCTALLSATHAPQDWATPTLSPPLSRTRGAHHRGQVLWQKRLGGPLLLLVVTTRGDPERVLGVTPTHLYGAALVPRPPLPAPAARDGVHTFQEVTAITGVHLVRLPSAPPDDPRGPRALSPPQTGSCGATCGLLGSPTSRPTADGRQRHRRLPLPSPPPPSRALHSTAHGTPQMHQEVVERARLPPRMPTRITVMSDSDGSPQTDACHHRRPRSRSPVSPGCAGETLAEREERRLAEAAMPVAPPAGRPQAAPTDTKPSTRGRAPAKETAPAAQAASPAAPPPEGAPEQGAETAAPASRAAAPTAAPGTPPARGLAPTRAPGASLGAAAAAAEGR